MISLASSHVHADIQAAFDTISAGGKKASAWLKDKISSKFVLPGIYRPMSLIPLKTWQAASSTTNGNEQSHRNINRDGVNLTILGGIMRGMQYDQRSMKSLAVHDSSGIYSRDQEYTHFRRLERSLNRHVVVQRRTAVRLPSKPSIGRPTMDTAPLQPLDANYDQYDANPTGPDILCLPASTDLETPDIPTPHMPSCYTPPLHLPVQPSQLSSYSELAGALNNGPTVRPSFSPVSPTTSSNVHAASQHLPVYDPRHHLSPFSSLEGALGFNTML